ncbi:MAG TPA: hypothetical protein VGU21_07120, partial [Streptosporangiaceae bacterium]|nr:hypothetical protein [Streptosporangiaceae bacterium]
LAEIRQLGGAIARDPAVPNAVPGRTVPFVLFATALDIPPLAGAGPRAVAALLEAVRPWRSPVTFPNLLGRSCTPAEVQAAWPDQTRARLLDIKQGWDLDNVFRVGHALLPAPAPTRLAALPRPGLPSNGINGALMPLSRHRWSIDVVTGRQAG